MKIVIPREIFVEFIKTAAVNKPALQKLFQMGNGLFVADYESFPEAKDLFVVFSSEVDLFEGAKTANFSKKCMLAFKGSTDDALLTYILHFYLILLALNHTLVVPNIFNICKSVLDFNLENYAENHVVSYFKYLSHYAVAKLIFCSEFNVPMSSAQIDNGLRSAQAAHTAIITAKMSAPKLAAIYFLMAAYYQRLSGRYSPTSGEYNSNLHLAGLYVDRGLSNLGITSVDKWKEFKDLEILLSQSALPVQILTISGQEDQPTANSAQEQLLIRASGYQLSGNNTQGQPLTSSISNQLNESANLKLALAHPDAYMLLTQILTYNHVAILSHAKMSAVILRQLCDKRFHWLFMQKFTSDEIVECCANANYFSLLKDLHVKGFIISNSLSLVEYQRLPVTEIMSRSSGNGNDVSCSTRLFHS